MRPALTVLLALLLLVQSSVVFTARIASTSTLSEEAIPLKILVLYGSDPYSIQRALYWLWWRPWVELFNLSRAELTREKLFTSSGSPRYCCVVTAGSYEGLELSDAEATLLAEFVSAGGGYLGLDYSMLLKPAIQSMCDVAVYSQYLSVTSTTLEIVEHTPFLIDDWGLFHPVQKLSGIIVNVTHAGPRCSVAMRFNASITTDPYHEPALLYGTYGKGRFIQFCGYRGWLLDQPTGVSPHLVMAFWCSRIGIALAPLRTAPVLLFTDLGNPYAPAPEYNQSLGYVVAAIRGYPVLLCTYLHPNSSMVSDFISLAQTLYRCTASASITYCGQGLWSLSNETDLITNATTLFQFYRSLGFDHSHVIFPYNLLVSRTFVEHAWQRIGIYATWGPTTACDDPSVVVKYPYGVVSGDGFWNTTAYPRRLWAWVSGYVTGWSPSRIASSVLPALRSLSTPLVHIARGERGSYHYTNSNPEIEESLDLLDILCSNHTGVLKHLSPDFIAIHAWERWHAGIAEAYWFPKNDSLYLRLNTTLSNPLLLWVWTDGRRISRVTGFLPAWINVTDNLYYVAAPPGFQGGWVYLGDTEPPHLTWIGDLNITHAEWNPHAGCFFITANPLGRHQWKLYQIGVEVPQPRYVLGAAFRIDGARVLINATNINESTRITVVSGPELPRFRLCTALLKRVETCVNRLLVEIEPITSYVRILLYTREPTAVYVNGQPLPRSQNGAGWWYAGGLLRIQVSDTAHSVEIAFAQGPEITVTAIDADRHPTSGVVLHLRDANGTMLANGTDVLRAAVSPGIYTVIATRFGIEVGRTSIQVGQGRYVGLVECAVRSLTVTVVDRYGRNAPNATVELWINDTLCLRTVANSNGVTQLPSVPTQALIHLRVRFRSVTTTLYTVVGTQSSLTVTVSYPPRLFIRIVDAEGQLAATLLTVQLLSANGSCYLSTRSGEASAYVTPGDVHVTVWYNDRIVASDTIQVYNDTVAIIQTVLTTLYVHVLSAAGTPVADAVVTLPDYGLQRRTGVNGTVAFRNLLPGPTQIVVELADLRASTEATVSPPATYLSITLESRERVSAPPPPTLFLLLFLVLALLVVVVNELRR